MTSSVFPVEILEQIVSKVDESKQKTKELIPLTLVNTAFRDLAQSYLFECITLHSDMGASRHFTTHSGNMFSVLLRILSSNSRLATYVRYLEVFEKTEDGPRTVPASPGGSDLAAILHLLTNVKAFRLKFLVTTALHSWNSIPVENQEAFTHIFGLPTLQSVHLYGVKDFPQSIMRGLRGINGLSIALLHLTYPISRDNSGTSPPPFRLRYLTLHAVPDSVVNLLMEDEGAEPGNTPLRHLKIIPKLIADTSDFELALNRLIKRMAESLRVFYWLPPHETNITADPLDISPLRLLTDLWLIVNLRYDAVNQSGHKWNANAIHLLQQTTSGIDDGSSNRIETVTFQCTSLSPLVSPKRKSFRQSWDEIEDVFKRGEVFGRLRTVRIVTRLDFSFRGDHPMLHFFATVIFQSLRERGIKIVIENVTT